MRGVSAGASPPGPAGGGRKAVPQLPEVCPGQRACSPDPEARRRRRRSGESRAPELAGRPRGPGAKRAVIGRPLRPSDLIGSSFGASVAIDGGWTRAKVPAAAAPREPPARGCRRSAGAAGSASARRARAARGSALSLGTGGFRGWAGPGQRFGSLPAVRCPVRSPGEEGDPGAAPLPRLSPRAARPCVSASARLGRGAAQPARALAICCFPEGRKGQGRWRRRVRPDPWPPRWEL